MKRYFFNYKKSNKFLFGVLIAAILWFQPSFADDRELCDKIARQVERQTGLPKNILTSIALVEAGRRDRDGTLKPWPWSLNHAGKSLFFDNKFDALRYLDHNISAKFKNIDVGCMQINVRWHRENFISFAEMIDPRKNIEYAARFLSNLKKVHGSWKTAIKHYHSSTSKLNVKYYAKVQKVWSKKTNDNPVVHKAALFLDENIIYADSRSMNEPLLQLTAEKNFKDDIESVSNFTNTEVKTLDNQIYLNSVLIESSNDYDREELKRYIKYKSSYLGKNIDMVLLFRDEFSKNRK